MGVEARCCPSKSTAHLRHMKRQPFLCNGRPCRGHCHCHHCCHLRCHCQLRRRCRCRCRCNRPSTLPLPLALAVAVSINHCRRHLCCIAVSHRCCHPPCRRPLPFPSLSAIAVAIAIGHHRPHVVGHFRELLLWRSAVGLLAPSQRYSTIEGEEARRL